MTRNVACRKDCRTGTLTGRCSSLGAYLEPAHIHVERDDSAAKVWLDPLEFSFVEGFREHECNEILRITDAHLDEFLRAWYIAFGGLQP